MKTFDAGFLAQLQGSPKRLAKLFTLTLNDDSQYLFTDFQRKITVPGVSPRIFLASNALQVSAIESTTGGIAKNAELKIVYGDGLTRDQMLSGLMDNATITIELCLWDRPDLGTVELITGAIQRKAVNDVHYGAWTIKGLLNLLDGVFGEVFSPECRNIFGDGNCGFDLGTVTETFSVASVTAGQEFTRFVATVTGARAVGFFNLGFATFGIGAGKFEVLHDTGGPTTRNIVLAIPRDVPIEVSDAGTLVAGCDKRHSTCVFTYDNIVNFRGEPFNPVGALAVQT